MKKALACLAFILCTTPLMADHHYFNGGPLKPKKWFLDVKLGIAPSAYSNRDNSLRIVSPGVVQRANKIPTFSHQFRQPGLAIGGEVGYDYNDFLELFLEFAHHRAGGRTFRSKFMNIEFEDSFTDYKAFYAWIGNRFYFPRIIDRLAIFVGTKIGVGHRDNVCFTSKETENNATTRRTRQWSFADNAISGGAQVGMDIRIDERFSFVFNFEVLATSGLKVNRNISTGFVPTAGGQSGVLQNLVIGKTGTLVSFPLTAGLRINF